VTDETVHSLHGQTLSDSLTAANIDHSFIIRPSGEAQKSFETLQRVLDGFFEAGLSRKDVVIAFGGGVMGDLTGFAASIYKRGCGFIQIPTTLLAQVDSSVGGKTAINNRFGKNLVGAFYQPRLVIADIDVLKTLPPRELKAGYAEVVKYGLLGDRDFFDWLEVNGPSILALDPSATAQAIATSCQTKARIVAEDEYENGRRALLNLGHTFGHALELESGYDGDLLHGEAVSIGMIMAFEFSHAIGLCPQQDVTRMDAHMKNLGMPRLPDAAHLFKDPAKILAHMGHDKKNEGPHLTLILAREIGESFVEKRADKQAVSDYLISLSKRLAHVG
jgi:3-dehydroquinate synthase